MIKLALFLVIIGISIYYLNPNFDQYLHLIPRTPNTYKRVEAVTSQRFIKVNGIELNVNEAGSDNGKLLLFIHGFPETGLVGWKYQIPYFAKLGYKVIAPDLRGFNTSTKPQNYEEITPRKAAEDMIALIDFYGREKAIVIGHDWGAAIAWYMGIVFPEKVEKLVIMQVPHPLVFKNFYRYAPYQLFKSYYMFINALPFSDWLLSLKNFAFIKQLMIDPKNKVSLVMEDFERLESAWRQEGSLKSMLGYYRYTILSALKGESMLPAESDGIVHVPVLYLMGENDIYLEYRLAQPSIDIYCKKGKALYYEVTHWINKDIPDRVNKDIEDFIKS